MTPDALKAGNKAGDTLLEKLQAALRSLDKYPYVFVHWASCTCGHIYRAATGRGTRDDERILNSRNEMFRELLLVTAQANAREGISHRPLDSLSTGELLAQVSDRTFDIADELRLSDDNDVDNGTLRKRAAILMIEKAIVFETDRNEQARLALIAQ